MLWDGVSSQGIQPSYLLGLLGVHSWCSSVALLVTGCLLPGFCIICFMLQVVCVCVAVENINPPYSELITHISPLMHGESHGVRGDWRLMEGESGVWMIHFYPMVLVTYKGLLNHEFRLRCICVHPQLYINGGSALYCTGLLVPSTVL